MKRPARIQSLAYVALLGSSAAIPALAATPDVQVLAQELRKVRDSGEVVSAVWTHRTDSCTLQILLRSPYARLVESPRADTSAPASSSLASTQVWLLGPYGTIISPLSRPAEKSGPPGLLITSLRYLDQPVERLYRFPLSASEHAVAVAIMVNDSIYIERLAIPVARR